MSNWVEGPSRLPSVDSLALPTPEQIRESSLHLLPHNTMYSGIDFRPSDLVPQVASPYSSPHNYTPIAPQLHHPAPATASPQVAHTPIIVGPTTADSTTSPRKKRKDKKMFQEVNFPINFPVHSVPDNLQMDSHQRALLPETIKTLKYATGIDERNFITVYEYQVMDQSIIWDYYTGYVHLTGIWKALGNSKADIVKLLDGSPELEPVFRRVRGGFLKIQGTWVPYDVARTLALRICYPIRYALIPLFGANFPGECLRPHERGYGQLQMRKVGVVPHRRRSSSSSTNEPPRRSSNPEGRRGSNSRLSRVRTLSSPYRSPKFHDQLPMAAPDCAIDDDSEDDSEERTSSPPPMPRKLSFMDARVVMASPSEFVEMLQATRSLQQLSVGSKWKSQGGGFECEGKQFLWDGDASLVEDA